MAAKRGSTRPSKGDEATPLLTETEVAKRLGVSRRTIQGWRTRGTGGPPYVKLGDGRSARIRYESDVVNRFVERCRRPQA